MNQSQHQIFRKKMKKERRIKKEKSKRKEQEQLEGWLQKILDDDSCIIVEGKHDKEALIEIGVIKERVMTLGPPLFKVVEEVAAKTNKVIILTDFDKKGMQYYKIVKHDLQTRGVHVDRFFREFLSQRTSLQHIEAISQFLKRRNIYRDTNDLFKNLSSTQLVHNIYKK